VGQPDGLGTNAMTLHTSAGCNANGNCNAGNANQGCSVDAASSQTFGPGFNNNPGDGGVYAMEWDTSSGIKIWVFPRNVIPGDISSGKPNPSGWPTNYGYVYFPFGSSCPSNHFVNHNIIVDLTFCGDWAGAVFSSQCSWTGQSCTGYLTGNPSAFSDAYFEILSIKLYQKAGDSAVADNSTVFVNSAQTAVNPTLSVVLVTLTTLILIGVFVAVVLVYKLVR